MENKDSKEKTPEQEAKEREEARALNVKKTLESKVIQTSIGANLVKLNPFDYGRFAVGGAENAYNKSMNSEEAIKRKQELSDKKLKEGQSLGVAGEPTISNYDLAVDYSRQVEQIMSIAKLSELIKYSKDIGAKLDFEVPKELQNYRMSLMEKAIDEKKGAINLGKLNEDEQKAFGLYEVLSQSYKRACALKTCEGNYFSDLNEQGKQIADSYKKEDNVKKLNPEMAMAA